jgi:transcriptional regulator with XRE-family HTH domain
MCVDLGISKSLMTDLKSGRKKTINAVTAQKIANYFDVTVGYLLGEEEKENPATNGDEVKISASKYDLLNDANKAFIDEMIEKLIKAQSAE